ncbi:MAG: efflux RND transporter permease subunit, partial [Candidatus Krumholzibacteria bacterium]|nr:efflux RND transporter permease subunit [Candidatus Krumholzibacteria bacterium]
SKFGLSQVVVIFDDQTDIYFARQLIMERLQAAELPEGSPRPALGPVSTGLGEVFHYMVESDNHSLTEITTAHNWIVKPQLRRVPGVAEVNTWGGFEKQFHVLIDPLRLIKHGLSFNDVFEALERNNRNVGGGLISPREGESILVHGLGLVSSVSEIENIIIEAIDGVPIRIRDVADVEIGHEIRRAVVTAQGKGESVLGLGFMLMGENSRDITQR